MMGLSVFSPPCEDLDHSHFRSHDDVHCPVVTNPQSTLSRLRAGWPSFWRSTSPDTCLKRQGSTGGKVGRTRRTGPVYAEWLRRLTMHGLLVLSIAVFVAGLGVCLYTVSLPYAGFEFGGGTAVGAVAADGPTAAAGVRVGDEILLMDGLPAMGADTAYLRPDQRILQRHPPPDQCDLRHRPGLWFCRRQAADRSQSSTRCRQRSRSGWSSPTLRDSDSRCHEAALITESPRNF